jgi:hypothetical protein
VPIYSAADCGQANSTGGRIVLIEQEFFSRVRREVGGRKRRSVREKCKVSR